MLGLKIKASKPPRNDLKSDQRHRNDPSVWRCGVICPSKTKKMIKAFKIWAELSLKNKKRRQAINFQGVCKLPTPPLKKSVRKLFFCINDYNWIGHSIWADKILISQITIVLRQFRDHHWEARSKEKSNLLGTIFFLIFFQIMFKQTCTKQNQIRLVEYSCSEVSDPCEVPWFVVKSIFS